MNVIKSEKENIKAIKPYKKTEYYLAHNKDSYALHQQAILNNPTYFGKSFLEALNDFDNAVNPFMNYDGLEPFEEYVDSLDFSKVSIIATSSVNEDNKSLNDFELIIEDNLSRNKTRTLRNNGEFTYEVEFSSLDTYRTKMTHTLKRKTPNAKDTEYGEIITITIEDPRSYYQNTMYLSYNITNNIIEVSKPANAKRQRVTKKFLKYKSELYTYLLSAINMAKFVTTNNIRPRKTGKLKERINQDK